MTWEQVIHTTRLLAVFGGGFIVGFAIGANIAYEVAVRRLRRDNVAPR